MKTADDERMNAPPSKVDALLSATHPEKLRRSERVFIRIPIQVKGQAGDGNPFSEQTATLVINRNGARVGLKAAVRPETRLTVTNLQNSMTCQFRVVARVSKSLGAGPEWGIECLEPDKNFWGISFPEKLIPRAPAPTPPEAVDALLECSACGFREFAQLSLDDYRQLAAGSKLERPCAKCRAATMWKFSFMEAEEEGVTFPVPEVAERPAERRRAKRLAIKLPVRVRLVDGSEEMARTENISKTGVCFSSRLELQVGARIFLTVGFSPVGSAQLEVAAQVVWRREYEPGKSTLYGVQLEGRA